MAFLFFLRGSFPDPHEGEHLKLPQKNQKRSHLQQGKSLAHKKLKEKRIKKEPEKHSLVNNLFEGKAPWDSSNIL